jgi:hypothetical protein
LLTVGAVGLMLVGLVVAWADEATTTPYWDQGTGNAIMPSPGQGMGWDQAAEWFAHSYWLPPAGYLIACIAAIAVVLLALKLATLARSFFWR